MKLGSDFKDVLHRPVNIFEDDFIKRLYEMDWLDRNWYFVNLFKNLKIAQKYDTNPCPQIGKSDFQNPKGWVNLDSKPPRDFSMSFDDYMKLIPNFEDPYPNNVVDHDGVLVVRDDLIPGNLGSKVRYAEALVQSVPQKYLLYAMTASGQAAKVLASVAKKYNKVVILIGINRKQPTTAHIEAMEHGAIMLYYTSGAMSPVRKRCRAFLNDQLLGNGLYIPSGVKYPVIVAGFAKSVNKIYSEFKPDVIFCASSTSVMATGIDLGTPDECIVHAVQVADNSSLRKYENNFVCYEHDQPFNAPVRKGLEPPFPCIDTYDAKAWIYAKRYKEQNPDKVVMFWNVAGPHNLKDVKDA
jgi:hypothetical protein